MTSFNLFLDRAAINSTLKAPREFSNLRRLAKVHTRFEVVCTTLFDKEARQPVNTNPRSTTARPSAAWAAYRPLAPR